MARYSRPQAVQRYPGEWAFILGAKLVHGAPAPAPTQQEIGMVKREAQNHEGLHELLDRVEQGEISTVTDHLHASVTISLGPLATNGTRVPSTTPTPTGDDDSDSDDGNDSDGTSSYDGDDHDDNPSHGSPIQPTVTALPDIEDGNNSHLISSGNGPNKGAIAGGVIGGLLFLGLLLGLFIFRTRIRQKITSSQSKNSRSRRWYNRMGPSTPEPIESKPPFMAETTTRFSKSKPSSGEAGDTFPDSNILPTEPAMIRYSTSMSRRDSRNVRYIRQSLLRGSDLSPPLGSSSPPNQYQTFYTPQPPRTRSLSPPFPFPSSRGRPRSRTTSDRFPIAVSTNAAAVSPQIPQTPSPTSTTTSPTIAASESGIDTFFHALSQPKHPIQAPQPVAVIPAFLIPETPVEPKDSRFSWSTNQTQSTRPQTRQPGIGTPLIPSPQTPSTASQQGRISVAESENPRFRGVNSWVNLQRGRLERDNSNREGGRGVGSGVFGGSVFGAGGRQSQVSLPPMPQPPTPAEFRQHPGRMVSYGASGERIVSEELDRAIYVDGYGDGDGNGRMLK